MMNIEPFSSINKLNISKAIDLGIPNFYKDYLLYIYEIGKELGRNLTFDEQRYIQSLFYSNIYQGLWVRLRTPACFPLLPSTILPEARFACYYIRTYD